MQNMFIPLRRYFTLFYFILDDRNVIPLGSSNYRAAKVDNCTISRVKNSCTLKNINPPNSFAIFSLVNLCDRLI